MSNKTENCRTSQTARSLLSSVWDFAKCIIFACFQRCHRSKWHVVENADLLWCFLARTGCTFICGVGRLEPKQGCACTFQSWTDRRWKVAVISTFQLLASVPTTVKGNQRGRDQKAFTLTNNSICIYFFRIDIYWKWQLVFIFCGSLKCAHLSHKQSQPCPDTS